MKPQTVAVQPRSGRSLLWLLHPRVHVRSDCGGTGRCGKCRVTVIEPSGRKDVLACQYVPDKPVTVVAIRPAARLGPTAFSRRPSAAGLAVDFGTTTISVAVVDTKRRRVLLRRGFLNPQLGLGSDVMTRVANQTLVRKLDFTGGVREVGRYQGLNRRRAMAVTANTVMAHFLWDKDPSGLGSYPYRSALKLGRPVSGRNRRLGQRVWMPPLLGSFVGADCTSAVVASGLHRSRRLSLLVDAGTNGEVVLGNRDRLLVCSTAAGPAFEGATLECGGLADGSAIHRVRAGPGGYVVETLHGSTPHSICGSGVLAAIRAALDRVDLLSSGRLIHSDRLVLYRNPSPAQYEPEEIYLSQSDVRQVQLAKAAIATGIRLLLETWPARVTDIKCIHLTGRFGAAIVPADAKAIGLLPDVPGVRIRRHPNLALLGAIRLLHSPRLRIEMTELPSVCTELTLAGHDRFEAAFVRSMEFTPWP